MGFGARDPSVRCAAGAVRRIRQVRGLPSKGTRGNSPLETRHGGGCAMAGGMLHFSVSSAPILQNVQKKKRQRALPPPGQRRRGRCWHREGCERDEGLQQTECAERRPGAARTTRRAQSVHALWSMYTPKACAWRHSADGSRGEVLAPLAPAKPAFPGLAAPGSHNRSFAEGWPWGGLRRP